MVLARITGDLNQLIIKWISNYAKILGEIIEATTVSKKFNNLEILKTDEFIHMKYIFIDQKRNKISGQCS